MERSHNVISSEDEHCYISCECGADDFPINSFGVFRCPKCGRGYRTELLVWEYEPDERDTEYEEADAIKARADAWWKKREEEWTQQFLKEWKEKHGGGN